MDDALSVYFITDTRTRSYVGYTTNVARRYRTHRLKLAHAARATRRMAVCRLEAYIQGFTTDRQAMSFEHHAKRRNPGPKMAGQHRRFATFLAAMNLPKFEGIRFTVFVRNPALIPVIRANYPAVTVQKSPLEWNE